MADISVIKVNNADYTIKDTTARNHIANTSNPHSVTKSQVGLGNVENKSSATIRGELTSSNVTSALGFTPANAAKLGAANGIATLDSGGKVPSSQLPSYVDDVVEGYFHDNEFYTTRSGSGTSSDPYTYSGEITGETGKIYVDKNSNITYRWSGTAYVEISASLALGETSSTAYRGDRGKTAYTHATDSNRLTTAKSEGLYKVAVTAEGHVKSVTAVAKADITALGIPASNTTYSAGSGLSLSSTTFNHASTVTAGTAAPAAGSGTNAGTVDLPTVTYNGTGHITAKGSKRLSVLIDSGDGADDLPGEGAGYEFATYTPQGSVSAPTVTLNVTKANGNGDCLVQDTATAGTLPSLSMSVSNETLTITLNQGNFPVYKTQRCVTDVAVSSVSTPTFTGTQRYFGVKLTLTDPS